MLTPAASPCFPAGAGGGAQAGESAVRAQLKEFMEQLPEPFFMEEIEMRCKAKTPYVVVALQEVSMQHGAASEWVVLAMKMG